MAPQHHIGTEIQRLRRQLEVSRWEMHCAISENRPSERLLTTALATHSAEQTSPKKSPRADLAFTAVTVATGVLALRTLPRAFRAIIGKDRFIRTLLCFLIPMSGFWIFLSPNVILEIK